MTKYGKAASKSVAEALHKEKEGTLLSGPGGKVIPPLFRGVLE